MGPLSGVKIIDMTTVLMGPYATQMLGDYGADVIKVEALDGDVTRLIGPTRHPGMGPVFLNTNRSKRSICLDLKKPAGRDAVLRLIASADVLVYNVRPQAMARLQLGYDAVSQINPRLIYAGVFGFGQDGPYAAKPAYDDLIQGATALPALMAQTSDGIPRYVPNALVDRIVGLTAVGAICASLVHRDRTGRGQRVDIPMFETMAGFVMGDHMGGLTYEPPLDKGGYARHLSRDRRPYKTSDGYICVIVYNDKQWENFFKATGRDDLRNNPKFATFAARAVNIDTVYAELARIFQTRTTAEWTELLDKADVPVLPMHDLESMLEDPHLVATNFFPVVDHPTEGSDPQHEGVRDLVGDTGGADAAGAAAQRARRRDFARSRILRRRNRRDGARWRHQSGARQRAGVRRMHFARTRPLNSHFVIPGCETSEARSDGSRWGVAADAAVVVTPTPDPSPQGEASRAATICQAMSFITGVGLTAFGKHEGSSSLDLMSKAAELAIADAGLKRAEIDGILCGYSTVAPHIMLATVFAEHFGIRPAYAHAVQVGGATGLAMTMLAHHLVEAGVAKHVLVVGGENRLTGQSRDASILALAQVGHPDYEVPLGPTIPAYYGLVASRYMHEYGVTQEDLAEFAVLMRKHALTHPGAQFHDAITVADVMASKPVALPLKLLDCCPVSDNCLTAVEVSPVMSTDRKLSRHARSQLLDHLRPKLTLVQVIVRDQQIRSSLLPHAPQSLRQRGDGRYPVTFDVQQHARRIANSRIILHENDVRFQRISRA